MSMHFSDEFFWTHESKKNYKENTVIIIIKLSFARTVHVDYLLSEVAKLLFFNMKNLYNFKF